MFILAFLGFTNFSRSLPLNDKLLHFICFCVATGVFYFIFDVEEYVLPSNISFLNIDRYLQGFSQNLVLETCGINMHYDRVLLLRRDRQ